MVSYSNDRILEVRNYSVHLYMVYLSSICLFVLIVKLHDRQLGYIMESNIDRKLKARVSQSWHD